MMRKLAGLVFIVAAVLLANVALAESIDGDPVIITGGNLYIGDIASTGIADVPGLIRWYDNNGEYFTLTAADMVANIAFTWPPTDGNADEFLQTDGNGVLIWATAGGYWQRNGTVLSPLNANDTVTIPDAVDEDLLLLKYSGADASGATIELWHNSATPADADKVGELIFQGNDHLGGIDDYVAITAYAEDVTDATEDGGMSIEVSIDGALQRIWDCWEDLVVINDQSNDVDFRIEGDTDTHLLFTDASTDRIGISDTTPDALLDIEGDGTTVDPTLLVTRNLASGSTDSPVVYIHQDNAGDDQYALYVDQDGTGIGINVLSQQSRAISAFSVDSDGIRGASTNQNGIVGTTSSVANNEYSVVAAQRTKLGNYADLDEQNALPADPQVSDGRIWLSDGTPANTLDHHLYLTDEASYDHDLTVQIKDHIYGQQCAQEMMAGMTWSEGTGNGASMVAAAVATPIYVYNFATDKMTASHGNWAWNAMRIDGEAIWNQSDIATGGQWDCLGSLVKVSVKYKVSAAAEFDSALLYLASNDGVSGATQLFPSIANGTWAIYEYVFDIGTSGLNWGISPTGDIGLHAGVRFDGKTLDDMDDYSTELDIEWIMVEQWMD